MVWLNSATTWAGNETSKPLSATRPLLVGIGRGDDETTTQPGGTRSACGAMPPLRCGTVLLSSETGQHPPRPPGRRPPGWRVLGGSCW